MLKDIRVLIVDDESAIRDTLSAYIRNLGYLVETSSNGDDALVALRGGNYSLMITDAQMDNGPDGIELTRAARAEHPSMAIILMTAFESQYPISAALRAGADGYISKPFSLRKFALIFERSYWEALSRLDWWRAHGGDDPDRGTGN